MKKLLSGCGLTVALSTTAAWAQEAPQSYRCSGAIELAADPSTLVHYQVVVSEQGDAQSLKLSTRQETLKNEGPERFSTAALWSTEVSGAPAWVTPVENGFAFQFANGSLELHPSPGALWRSLPIDGVLYLKEQPDGVDVKCFIPISV